MEILPFAPEWSYAPNPPYFDQFPRGTHIGCFRTRPARGSSICVDSTETSKQNESRVLNPKPSVGMPCRKQK